MTLTLRIRNASALDNGMPTEFVLHDRGATIGRGSTCDWSLPDPQRHISSRHCEIRFRDGAYWLTDTSTNGTFVNDTAERLQGEHRIARGDLIIIGDFEVAAELSGSDASEGVSAGSRESSSDWKGWSDSPSPAASAGGGDDWGEPQGLPTSARKWEPSQATRAADAPAAGHDIAGPAAAPPNQGFEWGERRPVAEAAPSTDGWGPTHDASDMPDGASVWEGPQAPADRSSGWSSAAADRPPPASPGDIWGQITEDNVVDWARGGFGSPVEPPPSDPLGLEEPSAINATPLRPPAEMMEASAPASAPAAAPPRRRTRPPAQAAGPAPARATAPDPAEPAPAEADAERLIAAFLEAAGVSPGDLKGPPDQAVVRAGGLLRRLVAGLVVLVEARARAKSQMGAETTRLELEGNNPIKFARSPEQALAQLLSTAERGFMNSDRAVEDAFYDLQSHQMATLKAMQGALRATLDRFSPESIRNRAETQGFLASILPAARDAALWRAYEREFSGVALGSDEAFMDVFAKEFRKAYEEQSRRASPAR
jgi:type VI secretion system FHA domain protein